MNVRKIEIIQNLFKGKSIKKDFLEYQYGVATSVSPIVEKKLEKKIDNIIDKWEKKEDDILKYRKDNKNFNLIRTLLSLEIVPRFPKHYKIDETYWLISKKFITPENILFYEKDGEEKLIADMDHKELKEAKKDSQYNINSHHSLAINSMLNKSFV